MEGTRCEEGQRLFDARAAAIAEATSEPLKGKIVSVETPEDKAEFHRSSAVMFQTRDPAIAYTEHLSKCDICKEAENLNAKKVQNTKCPCSLPSID